MSLQRYGAGRGDEDIPAWLLGQGAAQGENCLCGTHSRASPSPRSHLCYNPPQHPWVPCFHRHSPLPGCWVTGESICRKDPLQSQQWKHSVPPIYPHPSHYLLPCLAVPRDPVVCRRCRRLNTTVTSLSILSFLSFFFSQKSPSCRSHSLPLSGLFLMYPFGNRADRAEHGDFGTQRQSISINRADGITMLAPSHSFLNKAKHQPGLLATMGQLAGTCL